MSESELGGMATGTNPKYMRAAAAVVGEAVGAKSMCMLICMQSTSVRIDVSTHEELKRLASELHTTVGNTVALAV